MAESKLNKLKSLLGFKSAKKDAETKAPSSSKSAQGKAPTTARVKAPEESARVSEVKSSSGRQELSHKKLHALRVTHARVRLDIANGVQGQVREARQLRRQIASGQRKTVVRPDASS